MTLLLTTIKIERVTPMELTNKNISQDLISRAATHGMFFGKHSHHKPSNVASDKEDGLCTLSLLTLDGEPVRELEGLVNPTNEEMNSTANWLLEQSLKAIFGNGNAEREGIVDILMKTIPLHWEGLDDPSATIASMVKDKFDSGFVISDLKLNKERDELSLSLKSDSLSSIQFMHSYGGGHLVGLLNEKYIARMGANYTLEHEKRATMSINNYQSFCEWHKPLLQAAVESVIELAAKHGYLIRNDM